MEAWRGKLAIFGKRIESYGKTGLFDHCLGVLPQNPASVFTEITLEEELYEALSYEPVQEKRRLAAVRDMIWEMQLDGWSVCIRMTCPAVRSSGWRLERYCFEIRSFCCWMSRPRGLTRILNENLREFCWSRRNREGRSYDQP